MANKEKYGRWALNGSVVVNGDELPVYKKVNPKKENLAHNLIECQKNMDEAVHQLQKILGKYVELVSSGDCGFWNPEKDEDIIECRAFIKRILGEI